MRARCCAASSTTIRYSIRLPSPPSNGAPRSAASSTPTSAAPTGTTVFTKTGAQRWTWPDGSGPSYEGAVLHGQGGECRGHDRHPQRHLAGLGAPPPLCTARPRLLLQPLHAGVGLDELPQLDRGLWFGVERAGLLVSSRRLPARQRGAAQAGGVAEGERTGWRCRARGAVLLLGNVRCLGFYFSPVNFYFCYRQGEARYLLAEVSNTPGTSATTTCWIWRR